MITIYLDVLIVLNIYVNFFLLKATARFTHVSLKISRCVVSSVVGSFFSLTILMPIKNFFLTLLIKLAAAAVITAITFGIKDRKNFIKLLIYFYIINFIFAGIIGFLYTTFSPSFMAFNNSYFYVDFSLISLVVFTAIAYFGVALVRRLMDRRSDTSKKYDIYIKYKEKEIRLEALADTGNSLTDSFTGKPVVICRQNAFGFDEDFSFMNPQEIFETYGFRMLPYSTIGNAGLIPVFSPDEIVITEKEFQRRFKTDALIGLVNRDTPAIFNPKLLI